ncbi:iron complex outermembrane receptor protein [Pelomonas saccharophila]|uniref:Iron complex outermembrane receptor protein n=1 Tax=Roseateles saccharophilus TaxID=304 RepID=A0ABU1YKX6_ROSSA|nr:TonB-dependent receptor [Roseateles saccharophilus]MDR7268851.1 iron complex outermembrane receptor protein [Roseateles saccharophilus]
MAGAPALAQTGELPSLEDLLRTERRGAAADVSVSTASRQAQSADLAPAVTHVVSRQDIARLGLRTLGDVLRRMPGLEVREDDEFTRVAVRGVAPGDFNGRVLFLLDGLRLNDNLYDGGPINREFYVDVSLIERVEFTPGPGSALYGGNALLGVVNIVTQRADTLAGPQAHVVLSPRGQVSTRLSYAQRLDSGAEWLAAFSSDEEPHTPLLFGEPEEYRARLQPLEWDRARRWLLGGRSGGLSLRVGGVQRERGLYSFLPKSGDITGSVNSLREQFAQAGWEGRAADWDLHLGLAWQQSRYRSEQADDNEAELRTSRFEALGRWWLAELRLARAWGGPAGDSHTTSVGMDWQRDGVQRFRYVYLGETPSDENYASQRLGFYLQDEWRLAERQRLVLGLRQDGVHGGDSSWNPRAAWVWSPEPGQSLKLMWGTAFRAPNRFERALNQSAEAEAPRPERLRTLELAWQGPLPGLSAGAWSWQASLFTSHLVNFIERGSNKPYANTAVAHSRGAELGLHGHWGEGWQLQLSLMGQRNAAADGSHQAYSPSQTLKWALQMPVAGPALRLSLSGWATKARFGDEQLPGYAQHQAHLLWQPSRRWDFFVGAENVGGRAYAEASGPGYSAPVQRQGTRWQAGLTWRGDAP